MSESSSGGDVPNRRPGRRRRRRRHMRGAGGKGDTVNNEIPQKSAKPTIVGVDPQTVSCKAQAEKKPNIQPSRRSRAERETSAGGIVYRMDNGRALFLLIRDSYSNWGFPKGHLEAGEGPEEAAVREVQEETGLCDLHLAGAIQTIDWFFRFRGRLVHKVCHFYLMKTSHVRTVPQREEGITACRWVCIEDAVSMVSYANARAVLSRANEMLLAGEDGNIQHVRVG